MMADVSVRSGDAARRRWPLLIKQVAIYTNVIVPGPGG
jgi:hypothetical protein